MRLFSMGGARVTPDDVEEATARLGCWCKRSYGLTELPTLATGPLDDIAHRRHETTEGRAHRPDEVRIVDERLRESRRAPAARSPAGPRALRGLRRRRA